MIGTMKHIGSDEARRKFSEYLDQVERDSEHVEIMRHYRPAAIWVPVEWYERAKAALEQVSKTREEQGR